MREHKEIEINSMVVQTREKWQSLKREDENIVV